MSMGDVKAALAALPEDERAELIKLLEQLDRATKGKVERENFASFRSLMYPDYVDGAHLRIMADAFQRVAEGKLKRLIVTLPPRHMKSVQCSVLFPAWFIGRYPKKKIMQVSNTAELAQGFGRQVKNMIQSREYKDVFPDVKLAADSTAAGRWNTNKGGEYYAVGMGGALAGRGADCLVKGTMVSCPDGEFPIEEFEKRIGRDVYAYNEKTKEIDICKVEAFAARKGFGIYRVTTAGGRVVESTGDHLFYTGRGYVRASDLAAGDSLVFDVRNGVCQGVGRIFQADPEGVSRPLLFNEVQRASSCDEEFRKVQDLQRASRQKGEVLLPTLQQGSCVSTNEGDEAASASAPPSGLPHVHESIQGGAQRAREIRKILREDLFESSPCGPDAWEEKSKIRARGMGGANEKKALFSGRIQKMASADYGAGREPLCNMWRKWRRRQASCASHRPQSDEKLVGKSGHLVHQMSYETARKHAREASCDYVSVVERVREEATVYDIQVSGHHNFFANGILVHNCLIIDDCHSEAEALAAEAGDQSVYDKAYHWYMLARQRLQPGGAIIICVTRWSQRDLVAQILKAEKERGESEWEVIDFPAILPSGKQLWPEFWSLKELNAVKDELPIHRWSAQYQQNPVSIGAALIKSNWWRKWDIDERGKLPEMEYIIQSWDTATTANTRSNFSACTTWGMFYARGPGGKDYPQFILLDAFRARLEFPDLKQKAKELNAKFKPDALLIENTAQGTSLIPELRLAGLPVTPFNPGRVKNDKILRVNGVSDIFKSGQIWYVPSKQADEVIAQFEAFPNSGDGDDYVDSCTQAIATARAGGVIRLERDEDWTEDSQSKPGNRYYSVF